MRGTYRSNTMTREVKNHTCIPHHQTFTDISFFLFFFFLRWHALGSEVGYHDSGLLFRLGYFYLSVILKSHALVCLGVHGLAQIP